MASQYPGHIQQAQIADSRHRAALQAFINTLNIPGDEKLRLLQLTPDTRTGSAAGWAAEDLFIIQTSQRTSPQ